MNAWLTFFQTSEPVAQLSAVLLHSIWQSVVIGLIYFLLLKIVPSHKPELRHNLGVLSLVTILILGLGTWSIISQKTEPAATAAASIPSQTQPAIAESQTMPSELPMIGTPAVALRTPSVTETPSDESRVAPRRISSLLIPAWIAGVMLMMVRLICSLSGVRRHRSQAVEISDPVLLSRLSELCQQLEIKKKIQIAASSTLNNPGVIGIIKPIVLIPVSMLTTYSTSDIEAIIAHELTHIRRNDYFINLFQMLIEALFFFSPAIWWISHRVRMEREVCCDAAAMQATGQQFEYANLLLNQFSANPTAIPAFGNNKKMEAKERLLRIVKPNQLFNVKISVVRLATLLILTGLALTVLAKTSDLAVETVKKIMTPKERVEKLMEIANESEAEQTSYARNSTAEISLSGTVKTLDGSPLPKHTKVNACAFNDEGRTSGYYGIRVDSEGRFSATMDSLDYIIFTAYADGYAPTISEPIRTSANGLSEKPELTLEPGFQLTLKIVTDEGIPVAGAKIDASYMYQLKESDISLQQESLETDTNGIVRIEHASEYTMRFNIEAKGVQPVNHQDHKIEKGMPLTITMQKGLVAEGIIVSEETGSPITNTTIRLLARDGWDFRHVNKEAAKTDSNGRFTLDTLKADDTYTFSIEAEGYNPLLLEKVQTKAIPRRIELGPEIYIRGTISGNLDKLGWVREHTSGEEFEKGLRYTAVKLKNGRADHSHRDEGIIEVEIRDGIGYFELRNFLGDQVSLYSSGSETLAVITPNGKSVEAININMDSGIVARNTPYRVVEYTFDTPVGLPAAEGEINVWHTTTEKREQGDTSWTGMKIRVENGTGRASFPAPGFIKLGGSQDLAGYWLEPENERTANDRLVEPAETPLKLRYTLTPAGGISGTIVNEKGQPLHGMDINIHPVLPERDLASLKQLTKEEHMELAEQFSQEDALRRIVGTSRSGASNGTFAFTSLPLNHTYQVSAHSGYNLLASEPITLTLENPIQEVILKQNPPEKLSGRVLLPDGSPCVDMPVRLAVRILKHSFSNSAVPTDDEGNFEFSGLNPDPSVMYDLSIETGEGWQPIKTTLEPGSFSEFVLEKGLTLKGRVIDHITGQPLEGIGVATANLADLHAGMNETFAQTDSEGLFAFSTLASGEYAIGANNMELVSPVSSNGYFTTFNAGEIEFIELKVKPMTNMPHFAP